MNEAKQLSPAILLHIAQTLDISLLPWWLLSLLTERVPLSRYRKDATGALDEARNHDIEEKLAYFRDLVGRRETIPLHHLQTEKLSGDLRQRIETTFDRCESPPTRMEISLLKHSMNWSFYEPPRSTS